MQTTLFLVLLPAVAMAAKPRQVRAAANEPVQRMSVQSDGAVLKVADPEKKLDGGSWWEPSAEETFSKPAAEDIQQKEEVIQKPPFIKEEPGSDTDITKAKESAEKKADVKMHSGEEAKAQFKADTKAPQKDAEALKKETKIHDAAAPVRGAEMKAHPAGKNRKTKPAEGVSLVQDEPVAGETQAQDEEAEKSWKNAFFFFASLVLIAVLAVSVISLFYFNRDTATKAEGEETAGLKASAGTKAGQYINDSSSTSDSGEKIAMLFDRVRQSLEDLSDKTAQQADVAGGSAQAQASNTI